MKKRFNFMKKLFIIAIAMFQLIFCSTPVRADGGSGDTPKVEFTLENGLEGVATHYFIGGIGLRIDFSNGENATLDITKDAGLTLKSVLEGNEKIIITDLPTEEARKIEKEAKENFTKGNVTFCEATLGDDSMDKCFMYYTTNPVKTYTFGIGGTSFRTHSERDSFYKLAKDNIKQDNFIGFIQDEMLYQYELEMIKQQKIVQTTRDRNVDSNYEKGNEYEFIAVNSLENSYYVTVTSEYISSTVIDNGAVIKVTFNLNTRIFNVVSTLDSKTEKSCLRPNYGKFFDRENLDNDTFEEKVNMEEAGLIGKIYKSIATLYKIAQIISPDFRNEGFEESLDKIFGTNKYELDFYEL